MVIFCPVYQPTSRREAAGESKSLERYDWSTKIMFAPHPSVALEYWFFKVNAVTIALSADWIECRKLSIIVPPMLRDG